MVRYQGQTFRPQDLERGDRIQASVDRNGNRSRGFSSGARPGPFGDLIVVRYDAGTTVRFQGRAYSPENIERGDEVRIQAARGRDGRLLAQEIVVVGEDQP